MSSRAVPQPVLEPGASLVGVAQQDVVDVLLIEDSDDDALRLREALDDQAFVVGRARTLAGAHAQLGLLRPHCVLLDLSLPDAEGLDGLQQLRSQWPNLPIVVLTRGADEVLGLRSLAAGAQDHLVKSTITPELVRRAVRYAVERSHTAEQLAEVRERFRRTFDLGPLGIALVGFDGGEGRLIEVNRRVTEMLGCSVEQLVGHRVSDFVHWRDVDGLAGLVDLAVTGADDGTPARFQTERRLIHSSGSVVWCSVNGSTVRTPSGELLYGIVLLDDITERKLQEQALREAHLALDTAVVGIALTTLSGEYRTVNRHFAVAFGHEAEELTGLGWRHTVHPDDHERMAEAIAHAMGGHEASVEVRGLCRNGGTFEKDVLIVPSNDATGTLTGLFHFVRDVSDRRRSERALEASEAKYRGIVETADEGMWMLDTDLRTTFVNDRMASMLGLPVAEVLGRTLPELLSVPTARTLEKHLAGVEVGRAPSADVLLARLDGVEVWGLVASSRLSPEAGGGTLVMVTDISARKHAEQKLERLALTDRLTGLPNRALLEDRLEHALRADARDAKLTAVLFLDLDRFKAVNGRLGHRGGDELLQRVAERLGAAIGGADTLARLGGDEFVVLSSGLEHEDAAVRTARALIAALEAPLPVGPQEISVHPSIGVATCWSGAATADELLRDADIAMCRGKARGNRRFEVFDASMRERIVEDFAVEQDLARAMGTDQLALHYQPKVTLPDERVVGVEALLRWQHPERGPISPADFVPVAERTGLIGELGTWVLREACRQLGRADEQDPAWTSVAVNVSARQIEGPGFVDEVRAALAEADVRPTRLELEITETVLLGQDPEATAQTLQELRDLGVRVVLDDFGTGFSSLSYLTRFPLAGLKLDRSFISGFGEDEQPKRPIVEAVAAMAHALGLSLVGEGVETVAQAELLCSLGCDQAQGFLFARPMAAADIAAWTAGRQPGGLGLGDGHSPDDEPSMSVGEAATALGVSASTLRRWVDDGRVSAQRTAGGHRRFTVRELRRLTVSAAPPQLNVAAPPPSPLPHLAELLQTKGDRIIDVVAEALYRPPGRGWYASPRARGPLTDWLRELTRATRHGTYGAAITSVKDLGRNAAVGGASLAESSLFLERVTALLLQELERVPECPRDEVLAGRRVLAATRRGLLDDLDRA